uniref:Uncharacterized protein n=1 Tax=Oryza glumipatula TaxID=40148 RepID=A0A0E0ARF9_9ORYZ
MASALAPFLIPAHLLQPHAASASSGLQLAGANVLLRDDAPPEGGRGPHHNAVLLRQPPVMLAAAAGTPEQGNGPKINAVLRRPTPPGGAGPREGSGGRGGVIHAVADSAPQRPGAPAEGAGGNGGDVHVAPAVATSS